MNRFISKAAPALLLVLVTSCATATDRKAVFKESAKGGGIGCLLGAAVGKISGGDAKTGCLAGGVSGAIQAGMAEHKRQVREAKQLADDARRAGYTGQVITAPVNVRDKNGNSEATDGLERLVLTFQASDFAGDRYDLDRVLGKAAILSDRSKTPVTIQVGGSKSERAYMVRILKNSLLPDSRTYIEEIKGGAPRLIISPIPA